MVASSSQLCWSIHCVEGSSALDLTRQYVAMWQAISYYFLSIENPEFNMHFFLMRFCIVLPSPHCCFHCSATDFASSSRLADLRNPIHLYSAYCYRLCPYFRYDLNWFDLKRWETFRNYATEPLGPFGPLAPKGPTSTHIVTYLFKNPWCPSGTFATQVTMSSVDPGYVSASHSSRAPNCCPKPSSEMTSLCGRRDKLHHL